NYVGPPWLNVQMPDGKKRLLTPTVDDLTRHAWIAVTSVPSDRLNYWAVIGLFDGVRQGKYYCAKDSVEKFGATLKNEIRPIGELLKDVPLKIAEVALFTPTSTSMVVAGEGKWNWGTHHYLNFWKSWLVKSDIRYDVIRDENIDELKKYSVIIFPMGLYVAKEAYNALTKACESGSLVIVDEYCRQKYPKMKRWNVKYRFNPKSERKKIEKKALKHLADLKRSMRKIVYARAKGADDSIFTFVRERSGINFVTVINNARKSGEYTKLTGHPEFKPYGKPQLVDLSLKIPKNAVLYDFMKSKLLKGVYKDGKREVKLKLPAASGKLICVYPRRIASLKLNTSLKVYQKDSIFNLSLVLSYEDGSRVKGAQLIELTITTPDEKRDIESRIYHMKDGIVNVELRVAANDPSGEWKIIAKEKTSGLTAAATLNIK
ncbi:MAG: hypothetical protein KAG97_06270, partial [Victivallales bacterium]|nr:hypothetical protein [Victivallales bacterium]